MRTTEIREWNWDKIRSQLSGRMEEVYCAWARWGPMTTRGLAECSGIDVLNVRPRTTDLVGLGLVELVGMVDGQGVYAARSQADWERWLRLQGTGRVEQLSLI